MREPGHGGAKKKVPGENAESLKAFDVLGRPFGTCYVVEG